MLNRFSLLKVADGSLGERFIIVLENDAQSYQSKPMLESHARLALHKLGSSETAIASMVDLARKGSDGEPRD